MKNKHAGFTLMELMIVVAIIGIIAAIAYPSYQQYIERTRRATAAGCLLEMAQFMERFYSTNMTYLAAGNAPALPGCQAELADFYTLGFNAAPTATTYTLQMVPQGNQAGDSCGTLTINQAGTRTPNPTTDPQCWR